MTAAAAAAAVDEEGGCDAWARDGPAPLPVVARTPPSVSGDGMVVPRAAGRTLAVPAHSAAPAGADAEDTTALVCQK